MKKIISVTVTFLLAISCLAVLPLASSAAGPTGENLIIGGDFANGTGFTPNTTIPIYNSAFVTTAGYRTWFRGTSLTDVVKNDADSHGNYLKIKQYAFQGVPLGTGKTYTLTFDLKVLAVNSGKTALRVYLATPTVRAMASALAISNLSVDGFDGTGNVANVYKSTAWYTHSLTFTVSASAPSGGFALAFFNDDTASDTFCLDNVSLYEGTVGTKTNLMYDDSFDITTNPVTANSSVSETVQVITQLLGDDGIITHNWHQGAGLNSQYSRVASSDAHTGTNSMIVSNFLHQSFNSETNAVYQLSFWAKSKGYDKLSFRFVESTSRAVAINTEGSRTATLSGEWTKYSYILTMPQVVSSKTLLSFYTDNIAGDYSNYNANDVYLDDISLEKIDNAANVGHVGTAVRTSGVQGLRFKTSISYDTIGGSIIDGFTVSEYGTLAIKTAYLGGAPLVLNGTYDYSGSTKTAKKGVAYNAASGTNILFSDNGITKEYTAVLTGIIPENYQVSYTVRPYVIYKNAAGETAVCYGAEQAASIYNIARVAYAASGSNDGGFRESQTTRIALFDILHSCNPVYTEFVDNISNLPTSQIPV